MSHPVVYFEIYGPEPEALAGFYGALFGWSMQEMPGMNYRMVDTNGGGGINGGPFDAQAEFFRTMFDWTVSKSDGPGFTYGEIENPSDSYGTAGALSSSDDGRVGITLWAHVDDPQKYLEKAESLGATIDMEPIDPNEHLTVATFIDPQGNRFGVYRFKA